MPEQESGNLYFVKNMAFDAAKRSQERSDPLIFCVLNLVKESFDESFIRK